MTAECQSFQIQASIPNVRCGCLIIMKKTLDLRISILLLSQMYCHTCLNKHFGCLFLGFTILLFALHQNLMFFYLPYLTKRNYFLILISRSRIKGNIFVFQGSSIAFNYNSTPPEPARKNGKLYFSFLRTFKNFFTMLIGKGKRKDFGCLKSNHYILINFRKKQQNKIA